MASLTLQKVRNTSTHFKADKALPDLIVKTLVAMWVFQRLVRLKPNV